jgi:hypothetical protein
MTSDAIKAFFNENFFEGSSPKTVLATVKITIEKQELEVPGIKLNADHTIEQIVKSYYHYVSELPNQSTTPPIEQPETNVQTFINVEQIEHRKNYYSVEEHINDAWIVRNNDSGKLISSESPLHRTLVKKYREITE